MTGPAPGMIPAMKPMKEPRAIGRADLFQSSLLGKRFLIFSMRMDRVMVVSRPERTSATPNRPMATGMRPIPSRKLGIPKTKRCFPVIGSIPTIPTRRPRITIRKLSMTEPSRQIGKQGEAEEHEGKELGRTEFKGRIGKRKDEKLQGDNTEGTADKGTEGRHAEGNPCPASACHLISVETGNDRGSLHRGH